MKRINSDVINKYEDFLQILVDGNLVRKRKKSYDFVDVERFKELGFALFLAYSIKALRDKNNRYCFIRLDNHHTLFLTPDVNESGIFIYDKAHDINLGDYIDDFHKIFEKQDCSKMKHKVCAFEAFVRYNGAVLVSDRSILLRQFQALRSIKNSCKKASVDWIKQLIDKDTDLLRIFGGLPVLFNLPPRIFDHLFSGSESYSVDLEKFLNMFLCTYIGIKYKTDFALPEAYIDHKGYITYPIDFVVGVNGDSDNEEKILAVELTIGLDDEAFSDIDLQKIDNTELREEMKRHIAVNKRDGHFKQKIIVSNSLNNLDVKALKYLYIVLGDTIFFEDRYKTVFSTMASKQNNFVLGTLGRYKDLSLNLRSDWWDNIFLKGAYNKLLKTIEEEASAVFL